MSELELSLLVASVVIALLMAVLSHKKLKAAREEIDELQKMITDIDFKISKSQHEQHSESLSQSDKGCKCNPNSTCGCCNVKS